MFLKQLGAGEKIGPNHFTVDCNHHSNCVLVAQLPDHTLVVALHWLRNGVHLFRDFLVSHDASIGRGRIYLGRRSIDHYRLRHGVLRLAHFIPNLLLVFGNHRLTAHSGAANRDAVSPRAVPKLYLPSAAVQRPGSTQNTLRSTGSLSAGTMRSLPITRSCLPPVTISPASNSNGRLELLTSTNWLTSASRTGCGIGRVPGR